MRRLLVATLAALVFPAAASGVNDAGGVTIRSPERPLPPRSAPRAPGNRGELHVVPAHPGGATGMPFSVAVEGKLRVDPAVFAATVTRVLHDRRGWRAHGYRFQRVGSGPVSFEIVLASPALTDQLCAPLPTNGLYSCAQGSRVVLNAKRWLHGATAYSSLRRYRIYMINHEVGHILGRGHAFCPGAGAAAPLMVQQTKGVAPCRPNPWPLEYE